jgi:amidohydrolase
MEPMEEGPEKSPPARPDTDAVRAAHKQRVRDAVAAHRADLVALAEALHAEPELSFSEHRAAARLADALADEGFAVDRGIGELPTAFAARAGVGELHAVICAEYDALPGVGHACGHNLIAAAAVGAGLALAELASELDLTVTVLGTPAEEGGGGKCLLLERGAFDGAHLALMVHPWPEDRLTARCLAVDHLEVRYHGREAHASAAPEQGVNAGDAMVVAQVAIGLLRQHLVPGDQVHGIVDSGGQAPNIVPRLASGRFMLRSPSLDGLRALRPRITACFEAGALATGAQLEIRQLSPTYSHMEPDPELLALWRSNAEALGRRYDADDAGVAPPCLSTDMANVSLVVPTIHPMIGVDAGGSVNHQPEFAAACRGPAAERAVVDGAVAMATTVVDAASEPAVRRRLLDTNRRGPA